MAYSYENELANLKTAQQNAAKADLENTRNTTLSDLASESAKNTANYATQRNTANVQNKMNARNFQEYLASTGRANSGIDAQARLMNRNNLNTQLNSITGAENAAKADINRQITNANNAYNSGLASANATAEANYINNLLDQRYKAQQQANADREFNESVRQFNEQMALERQKMYSNFSSGGSGRRSGGSSSGGSSYDDLGFTDTTGATSGGKTSGGSSSKTSSSSKKTNNVGNAVKNLVKAELNVYNTANKIKNNPLGTVLSLLKK